MNRKTLSLLMALSMIISLFAPALAAELPSDLGTATVSVETKTVNGGSLIEPAAIAIEEGDTVYTLLDRAAAQSGVEVINTSGSYIQSIGDFAEKQHGAMSGWLISVNGSRDYPFPEPKNGDVVRFTYTCVSFGNDVLLVDIIDKSRVIYEQSLQKIAENDGNPFNEAEGYIENESSLFNKLSAKVGELGKKLGEIDAKLGKDKTDYKTYVTDLGSMVWGTGSDAEILLELCDSVAAAMKGGIPVTGGELFIEGAPSTVYVGSSYKITATLTPENATNKEYELRLNFLGDPSFAELDESGSLKITGSGVFQVELWHSDSPSARLAFKTLTAKAASEILNDQISSVKTNTPKYLKDKTASEQWTISSLIAGGNQGVMAKADVQAQISSMLKTVHSSTKTTDIARCIIILKSLGLDPAKLPGTDGNTFNAIEKLSRLAISDNVNGAAFALSALDSGAFSTDKMQNGRAEIIAYLKGKQQSAGAWGLSASYPDVDMTAMVLTALGPYYTAAEDTYGVKESVELALAYLASKQQASGSITAYSSGSANTDAMCLLAFSALGIDPLKDTRFVKGENNILTALMGFKLADGSFEYYGKANVMATEQAYRAIIAYTRFVTAKKGVNPYDFTSKTTPYEQSTSVSLRIEGISENKYYQTTAVAHKPQILTVFDLLKAAVPAESLVASSSWVSSIYGEAQNHFAVDYDGWQYRVNGVYPKLTIGDYALMPGDKVEFYYGGLGILYPDAPRVEYSAGGAVITFTAPVTTYDESWNETVETKPVSGMSVTWGYDGGSTVFVTDENGKITVPADKAQGGQHSLAVSKTQTVEGKGELPLVVRYPKDKTIKLELQDVVTSDKTIETTKDAPYTIYTVESGKTLIIKTPSKAYTDYVGGAIPQFDASIATGKGAFGITAPKTSIYTKSGIKDWDGSFMLPHLKAAARSVAVDYTMIFGTGRGILELGSAVRIEMPDLRGKQIGYIDQNGDIQPIALTENDSKDEVSTKSPYAYLVKEGKTVLWARSDNPIAVYTRSEVPPPSDNITVSFKLVGDTKHGTGAHTESPTWIAKRSITLPKNATVKSAFDIALPDANVKFISDGSYVSSINGLAEFDNGPLSGWVYTVNGAKVDVGYSICTLKDGDNIVWKYIDSYSDSDVGGIDKPSIPPIEVGKPIEFPDVAAEHWAKGAIDFVSSRKLMEGTGKGFSSEASASRSMVVSVLYRLGGKQVSGDAAFNDVTPGIWYYDSAVWAKSCGIISGSGGSFMPNGDITREQLAVMLYGYLAYAKKLPAGPADLSSYSDASGISAWAREAMSYTVSSGLLVGADGQLNPSGVLTRAELAVVIEKLAK